MFFRLMCRITHINNYINLVYSQTDLLAMDNDSFSWGGNKMAWTPACSPSATMAPKQLHGRDGVCGVGRLEEVWWWWELSEPQRLCVDELECGLGAGILMLSFL
jgi:hypothetical protein